MSKWLHKPIVSLFVLTSLAAATASTARADVVFGKVTNLTLPVAPTTIAVADVDGNGRPDIITASSNAKMVHVMLNQAGGTFSAPVGYNVGLIPTGVAVGEVTGDTLKDIVVSCAGNSTVNILKGTGGGAFSVASTPATTNAPNAVALGDLNADGVLDIVTANGGAAGSVTVLLSKAEGVFEAPAVYQAGTGTISVALADVDGDKLLDVITANQTNRSVSLLRGAGGGQLQAAKHFTAGTVPYDIVTGDFDGDRLVDLAVADNRANGAQILMNGGGTFDPPVLNKAGSYAAAVSTGDLNSDGRLDVVMINQASQDVIVFAGNGDGTFLPPAISATGVNHSAVAVGDLNVDGLEDVVTANVNSTVSVIYNDTSAPTGMAFGPASTNVGSFTMGTLSISRDAPEGGAELVLTASDPNVVFLPPSVKVLPGERSVRFVAAGLGEGTVTVGATLNGITLNHSLVVAAPSGGGGGMIGDLNCDGRVDSADIALLSSKITGRVTSLPPCN